jgi:mannose-1-phosphate guanylyltransferase
MASLHSDHFIANEEAFRQALLAAEQVAREGYLVTLGITPSKPETGYGYVQRRSELGQFNNHTVYEVKQFLEKPDLATAEKFVASGEYYWNSGMFIWQLSTLYDSFSDYMPEFYSQLGQMEQAIAAGQAIDAIWQDIQSESIDEGIMERAKKVAVIPVDFGWNDVGSWAAIHEINQPDEDGNVVLEAEHFGLDSVNILIDGSNRLIATIGLDNVVIVDTDDALLVCAKDKVQDIKQIVNWLKETGRTELL